MLLDTFDINTDTPVCPMTLCPMHTLFRFLCDSSFWYHLSLMPLDWPSQGQTGHAVLFLVVFPGAWYKCMVYTMERKDGGGLSFHCIHLHHSLSSFVLGMMKCPVLKESPCQWFSVKAGIGFLRLTASVFSQGHPFGCISSPGGHT